jgi:Uma2 family endonuclease
MEDASDRTTPQTDRPPRRGLIHGDLTMSTLAMKPQVQSSPSVRMTVEEFARSDSYHDKRTELIDGIVVRRDSVNPPHAVVTGELRRLIDRMLPADWCTREDKPVVIPPHYEPLPDIAIVRGTPKVYTDHHPRPADVAALIEVSDATLSKDQGKKLGDYARGGISVYWIVNLVDHQIEVYANPGPDGYETHLVFTYGQSVPVVIDGVEVGRIAVTDILPEPEPAAGGNGA